MTHEIIPALLVKSEEQAVTHIMKLGDYSGWIQIDVLDGTLFRQTSFFDPDSLSLLLPGHPIELHLMTAHPKDMIDAWHKSLPTQTPRRALWHIEAPVDHRELITYAKQLGWEVGLAIGPNTSIEQLKPFLTDIQEVLVLGVPPGQSGQPLVAKTVETARQLAELSQTSFVIGFDGGVNSQTINALIDAGVQRFCMASAIFASPEPRKMLEHYTEIVSQS